MAILPAEIEGPVNGLPVLAGDGNTVTMKVMNVDVIVPRLTQDPDFPTDPTKLMITPIHSPTKQLTLAELANGNKFDGRMLNGFDGATAIIEGNFDTTTKKLTATAVEIEPAENLLLGALTSANPLEINGIRVAGITDERMKFEGFKNEFGFFVVLDESLRDKPASAEGYFDGTEFRAHLVELDSSAQLVAGQPTVSLTRTRTRSRLGGPATVDIRGGIRFEDNTGVVTSTVLIKRVEKDPLTGVEQDEILIGIDRPIRDGAFPSFGLWRLSGPLVQPVEGIQAGEAFPLTAPPIHSSL